MLTCSWTYPVLSTERRRFSAAMMRSVEVGIQRSAAGHTRAHLDPAGGAADAEASVTVAAAAADACLISSVAAILVTAAARRMRHGGSRHQAFPRTTLNTRGGFGD